MRSIGVVPPPPAIEGRSAGGSRWVELTSTPDDISAHLLSGRLLEEGIESVLEKNRKGADAWLHAGSNPWAPVTLFVRQFQLTDAQVLLAEIAYEGPAIEPPDQKVVRKRGWRGIAAWWALALLLGAGLTQVALAQTARSIGRCDLPLLCGRP